MPMTTHSHRPASPARNGRPIVRVCLALFFALTTAGIFCGCASGDKAEFTPLEGETTESQWEMRLVDGGNDTQLTGAMAVSARRPDEARLYVMLPFGQTLGKCVLSGGRADCDPAAPGVAPLLQKAAGAMAKILAADADVGGEGMFAEGIGRPKELRGRGWRCRAEDDWSVYREDGAPWTLRLKRMK